MKLSEVRETVVFDKTTKTAELSTSAATFTLTETESGVRVKLRESYRRHREILVLVPVGQDEFEICVGLT